MYKYSRIEHVGLDAHIERIAVGIARSDNEGRLLQTAGHFLKIANRCFILIIKG
jgi:hypothetical protein